MSFVNYDFLSIKLDKEYIWRTHSVINFKCVKRPNVISSNLYSYSSVINYDILAEKRNSHDNFPPYRTLEYVGKTWTTTAPYLNFSKKTDP